MKKKLETFGIFYGTFFFLELLFRLVCTEEFFPVTMIHTLIYIIPIALLLSIISHIFKDKVNKWLFYIMMFIINFWYAAQLVFKVKFKVFLSVDTLGLSDQLTSFMGDVMIAIGENIIYILLIFLPFILSLFFIKKLTFEKFNKSDYIRHCFALLMGYLLFMGSLYVGRESEYSVYELYYKVNNNALMTEKTGVLPSSLVGVRRAIFGFEENLEDLIFIFDEDPEEEDPEKPIEYNVLDVTFKESSNSNIEAMNEYFSTISGTKKHEYTGVFEDKNLILFMAESFNEVAVSKELTPTLYKLVNESFVFENFYSPVILSTIGGEFQELTGLYPNLNLLSSVWRKGTNYYPFGYATLFESAGYSTYAYHNNQYNFQNRDTYLKSLGFDNYLGCFNGLEKLINCNQWPQSDMEMIDATVSDYLGSDEPFMTYYATVSGHMAYNWGNAIAKKHRDKVEDLPYSTEVKAYLATQIELDLALEILLDKLEEAGELEDTVIALVSDHYPYGFTNDVASINELSDYTRDGIVEINSSSFILWNSEIDTVEISKVGSQIDVLPTILNAFGLPYDSRLIIGQDILSDEPGLAIFSDNSWVSDYGTYFASSGKFVSKEGTVTPDDYISNMNAMVRTKIAMSKFIMEYDYYGYLFN